MIEYIAQYWVGVAFGVLLTLFSFLYKQLIIKPAKEFEKNLDRGSQEQQILKLGVQALLRDRIVQAYNHYTDKGFCPIDGRENVQALYKQYHALGGNGTIPDLIERLKRLPTEKEDNNE